METDAAQDLEPAHGASASAERLEARLPLAHALQQMGKAEGRRRAALAGAAKRQEEAAQQRAAAIAEAPQRQKLAAEQRRIALAEATERLRDGIRACEVALAAAAREEQTANDHYSRGLRAARALREQAHAAAFAADRTEALAAAAEHRTSYLEAVAGLQEATLAAAENRRHAVLLGALEDRAAWDYVSERMADRRPFIVHVSRVSELGLHVSVGGLEGVILSRDVVWWDRETVPAPQEMIARAINVVVVGVLPSGVIRLSERAAVEPWRRSLWQHYRDQDVFWVDVLESNDQGVTIGYEDWVLVVSRVVRVHEWLHPDKARSGGDHPPPVSIRVQVTAYDRDRGQLILSERAALVTLLDSGRAVGESFRGTVSDVGQTRVYVRTVGIDGYIDESEMDWRQIGETDLEDLAIEVGKELPVVMLPPRLGYSEIRFSARRATWPIALAKFTAGRTVPGVAIEVTGGEVLLHLPDNVLGRASRRNIVARIADKRDAQYPSYVISRGDIVPVKILRVNREQVRLDVSYREGRAEASEGDVWKFDDHGRVIQIPDEVRAIFPAESAAIESVLERRRENARQSAGLRDDEG